MRAVVHTRYGAPRDVLELRNVDRPTPGEGEVLFRVRAAAIHADVWHVVTGWPMFMRAMGAGLVRPRDPIPGTAAAGVVETVCRETTRFQPGDRVFGEIVRGHQWRSGGAFAEFAAVPEEMLEHMPPDASFEHAAALPTSGLLALQGVRTEGRVRPGDRVLINGAGGAVGTLSLQLARADGAHVTAVDATEKLELLRSLGADRTVDYTREDFTYSGELYDVIIDIPGNRSFDDLQRVLGEGGRYVYIGHDGYGASGRRWRGDTMGRMLRLQMYAPFGRAKPSERSESAEQPPMAVLRELLATGALAPVIDRAYPLDDVPAALDYLASGRALGMVVVSIDDDG